MIPKLCFIFAKYRKYGCLWADGSRQSHIRCAATHDRGPSPRRLLFAKGHFLTFASKDPLDSPLEIDYTRKRGPDNDFAKYRRFQSEETVSGSRFIRETPYHVTSFDRIDTLRRSFIARKQGSGMQGMLIIQDLARQARISKTATPQVFNQNISTSPGTAQMSHACHTSTQLPSTTLSSVLKSNSLFVNRLCCCPI